MSAEERYRAALEKIVASPCPLVGDKCSCCGFAISVAELALDDDRDRPDRLVDETAYDDEEDEILELRAELAEARRRLAALERQGAIRALEDPEAYRRGAEDTRKAIERWLADRYDFGCRTKIECGETFIILGAVRSREYERVKVGSTDLQSGGTKE